MTRSAVLLLLRLLGPASALELRRQPSPGSDPVLGASALEKSFEGITDEKEFDQLNTDKGEELLRSTGRIDFDELSIAKAEEVDGSQDRLETEGFVTLELETGAACLDGTPYKFTINKKANANFGQWTIWTEGGGSCWDAETCEERAKSWQGSSNHDHFKDPKDCGCLNFDNGGTAINCTCVRLPSCDGGFFTGNLSGPYITTNGTELMLRGRRNIMASLENLLKDHGLGNASEVVISGTSAGAVSSVLYLDKAAALFPPSVKVHGVPVGGFTIDHLNLNKQSYFTSTLEWTFKFHNSKFILSEECQASFNDAPWMCMVISNAARYVKTPMFFLNSKYDSWQLGNILGLDWGDIHKDHAGTGKLLPTVLEYGKDFMDSFSPYRDSIDQNKPKDAAYLTSCICHTDDCNFLFDHIENTSIPELLGQWYENANTGLPGPPVYVDAKDPNYDCCMLAPDQVGAFGCMNLLSQPDHTDHLLDFS